MFNSKDDDYQPLIEYEGGADGEFEGKWLKVSDQEGSMPLICLVLNICCCPIGTLIAAATDKKGMNKQLLIYALATIVIIVCYNFVVLSSSMYGTVMMIFQILGLVNWCLHLFLMWNNFKYNQKKNGK